MHTLHATAYDKWNRQVLADIAKLFSVGVGGDCGIVGHDLVQAMPLDAILEAEALCQFF